MCFHSININCAPFLHVHYRWCWHAHTRHRRWHLHPTQSMLMVVNVHSKIFLIGSTNVYAYLTHYSGPFIHVRDDLMVVNRRRCHSNISVRSTRELYESSVMEFMHCIVMNGPFTLHTACPMIVAHDRSTVTWLWLMSPRMSTWLLHHRSKSSTARDVHQHTTVILVNLQLHHTH